MAPSDLVGAALRFLDTLIDTLAPAPPGLWVVIWALSVIVGVAWFGWEVRRSSSRGPWGKS